MCQGFGWFWSPRKDSLGFENLKKVDCPVCNHKGYKQKPVNDSIAQEER